MPYDTSLTQFPIKMVAYEKSDRRDHQNANAAGEQRHIGENAAGDDIQRAKRNDAEQCVVCSIHGSPLSRGHHDSR